MSDITNSFGVSVAAMDAQSRRLRMISENISNADTPGFHRKFVTFAETDAGGVEVTGVELDHTEPSQIYDPAHPMANDEGYYQGSNVSLVIELADAREAQRSYEANLRMFDQARSMASATMDLLRK